MELDLSGRRVGHIRLESLLGTGGMGNVYLGFDEVLERRVAVKALRSDQRLNHRARQRLLREARVLSRLDHPNLCRVYDLVEEAGRDFLVMEYVEGVPLSSLAAAGMSDACTLDVAERVARALSVAHRERVVHRDLKPDNIMVLADGEVKILDFGLARSSGTRTSQAPSRGDGRDERGWSHPASQAVTEHGSMVGTIRYMSPEQAAGKTVDEASDIYSLGVLVHELVTGRIPYPQHDSDGALIRHIRNGDTQLAWGFDPDLDRLVARMLDPDPQQRPGADEAARRLRWIRDKPRRAARRLRRLSAAAIVLALLATSMVVSRELWRPRAMLASGDRARVAVLPFANRTGSDELGWVERGLAEMVARTVSANPQLEILDVGSVAQALSDLGIGISGEATPDELVRIGGALGCRFVVETAVDSDGARHRLGCTVHDRLGSSRKLQARGDELTRLAGDLSSRLSRLLTPQPMVPDLLQRFSVNSLANQAYAVGQQRLTTVGPRAGQHYFEVCLDLDPAFSRARLALARCRLALDRWQEADGLAWAVLDEARAARDRELEASSLHVLAGVAHYRGELGQAQDLWQRALGAYRDAGRRGGEVAVLNNLGVLAFKRGENDAAEALYGAALKAARAIEATGSEGDALVNLGSLARRRGDLDVAAERFEGAAAIYRHLGARADQALVAYNLATLDLLHGDLASAEERLDQVVSLRRELADRRGEGEALEALGAVAHGRGDLARTESLLLEALAIFREIGYSEREAGALQNLAAIAWERGDLDAAISLLEEALQGLPETADTVTRAGIELDLSEALLEAGRPEHAQNVVDRASRSKMEPSRALLLEARIEGRLGNGRRALELAVEARSLAGDAWTQDQERLLEELRASSGGRAPREPASPAALDPAAGFE